jgi:hypothetical protein
MKKQVSVLMIACQISMGILSTGAFASSTTAPTAEEVMIANIMAMQGVHVAGDAAASTINGIVTQYDAAAPADGREQRLQDALVALNIFTPDQANKFVAKSHHSHAVVAAASSDEARDVMTTEINELSQLSPKAAQFSSKECWLAVTGEAVGFFGGIFTILEGNWTRQENPTCSSTVLGQVTITVAGEGSGPGTLVSTTCTNPSDHPHAAEGDWLNVAGVGILAATVFLMYKAGDCS